MKSASIFSAVLLGASILTVSAYAQDAAPKIPGSETIIKENEAATRDAVAEDAAGATGAAEADTTTQTIVPGSEAQIQLNEATERDTVAAGIEGETTGETAADGTLLVPGSGATMSQSEAEAKVATTEDVLQDEASTDAVK